VHYETLPAAVWEFVAPHFLRSIDDRQCERMAQAARINSKAPVGKAAEFASDVATKQATASVALWRAIDAFARPPLQRLAELHTDNSERR